MNKKINIKSLNTFGISVYASNLIPICSLSDLNSWWTNHDQENFLILGGGSNILFTEDFQGTILKSEIKGKEIISEDEKNMWISYGSGEVWHDCVLHSLDSGLSGIENLSLIPGNIGAAPIQNIGAYGVELKDVFVELEAFDLKNGKIKTIKKEECEFGYRDSIFKKQAKGKYFITKVILKLNKHSEINSEYGAIRTLLNEKGISEPGPRDISDAVIEIRKSKLPDPAEIGNGGSFFKNPVVSAGLFKELKNKFPELPSYSVPNGIKIPAGWLIDQDGWKGYKRGNVGVHKNQALVLVNYGNASGKDIWDLAQEIQQSVFQKFGIQLEPEVNIA